MSKENIGGDYVHECGHLKHHPQITAKSKLGVFMYMHVVK